ncbi:uncharacterized protein LOC141614402 [Silene latifolia]|uniref:uncharacterized protein LOC141614402 n=1 Tax=Silene latifolia TaxID=37657 RepID=UPI003D76B01A
MPGVPANIEEGNPESYADSPFVDEIVKVDLPKKFVVPSMRTYDGIADPQNHVAYYKQWMLAASIPIVEAFRQGLPLDSDFYDELTMNPSYTFEDVQAKALSYIRLEEDKNFKAEITTNVIGYKRSNRKSSSNRGGSSRPSPYTRPDRSEVNYAHEQRGNPYTYPPIQEYNFFIDTIWLIKRLDNMGDILKWPKKTDNPNSRKDTTRWCEFHMDIGHTIEEYLGLRRQMAYLLNKGCLKDLMP